MTTLTTIRGHSLRRFLRHYLEMIMAMVVGMVVLGAAEAMLLNRVGWAETLARPETDVLIMATNMIVAMAAWMRVRGHGWAVITEMAVAMYLPFVVLFVPLWLGVLSPTGLMVLGHVLMLLAMAAVMCGAAMSTPATTTRGHIRDRTKETPHADHQHGAKMAADEFSRTHPACRMRQRRRCWSWPTATPWT